jgi:hypothetical protein
MAELIDLIKQIAHEVSENYLLHQSNMNDAIFLHAVDKELNEEIVKRICELSNQNVYLSLFNNPNVNKANILFDMADSAQILNKLQKSEQDMKEYKIVPKGFKTQLGADKAKQEALKDDVDFQTKKLASFDELQYAKAKYTHLLNSFETLKTASLNDSQEAFSKIFNDAKLLVAQGDSIADMAKVAMRYAKSKDFDMIKIAKVYDLISTELKNNGYTVNEELTKLSSLAINQKSKLLEPVMNYMLGLSKVAALTEICDKIKESIKLYDNEITKTAGLLSAIKNNKIISAHPVASSALVGGLEGAIVGGITGSIGASAVKNKNMQAQ